MCRILPRGQRCFKFIDSAVGPKLWHVTGGFRSRMNKAAHTAMVFDFVVYFFLMECNLRPTKFPKKIPVMINILNVDRVFG